MFLSFYSYLPFINGQLIHELAVPILLTNPEVWQRQKKYGLKHLKQYQDSLYK